MSNPAEQVSVIVKEGVQIVRLNRPHKKNAFTQHMYKGLTHLLRSSANDDRIKFTVFTGNGDFYSSGNDLMGSSTDMENDMSKAFESVRQFVAALIDHPKLLIAVVNGPAIGIATTTLTLFDIVYAADTAYFVTPFTKLGLCAEACSSYMFPKIFGPSKAGEMLYLGYKMSANEALSFGFVSKVFKLSKLDKEIWPHIMEIASLPQGSIMASKNLVRSHEKEILHAANNRETEMLTERYMTDECSEAILSFVMKKNKL